jgi:hypothetical protein
MVNVTSIRMILMFRAMVPKFSAPPKAVALKIRMSKLSSKIIYFAELLSLTQIQIIDSDTFNSS